MHPIQLDRSNLLWNDCCERSGPCLLHLFDSKKEDKTWFDHWESFDGGQREWIYFDWLTLFISCSRLLLKILTGLIGLIRLDINWIWSIGYGLPPPQRIELASACQLHVIVCPYDALERRHNGHGGHWPLSGLLHPEAISTSRCCQLGHARKHPYPRRQDLSGPDFLQGRNSIGRYTERAQANTQDHTL